MYNEVKLYKQQTSKHIEDLDKIGLFFKTCRSMGPYGATKFLKQNHYPWCTYVKLPFMFEPKSWAK